MEKLTKYRYNILSKQNIKNTQFISQDHKASSGSSHVITFQMISNVLNVDEIFSFFK